MGGKIYRAHLSTASDARAVRTRQALRAAMLQLLEAKPLDRITIRDVCASAGIGYTTFFRHHPTKEVLLDDVAAEEIRRLVTLALPLMDMRRAKPAAARQCRRRGVATVASIGRIPSCPIAFWLPEPSATLGSASSITFARRVTVSLH